MSQLTRPNSQESTSSVLAIDLPATAENVMLVRQTLDGAIRGLGASQRTADDMKLAVTEACSNVVKYAYTDSGDIQIELSVDGELVLLVVSDSGNWREPATDADIEQSGMGIPLMEAVSTSFELTTGDNGTKVAMSFPLEGPGE